jgi:hypothetical protein
MTARLVRAIAILFLVYTGADLTVPQFCGEEMGIPKFAEASASTGIRTDAAFATDASESRQDPPSERTHSDEDCFCCCTHVLPGHTTAPVAVPELNSSFRALKKIDAASPPLQGPYHPPRFA